MWEKLNITIFFSVACVTVFVFFYFTIIVTSYYEMPPLYKMDDYDRCMEEFSNKPATYCYVTSVIKPNDSSTLWHTIKVIEQVYTYL